MYRKLIACLLVFFLLCTPAYADSSLDVTTDSFIDYGVSPTSIYFGTNVKGSLSLYDNNLMGNIATYPAGSFVLSEEDTIGYFSGPKLSYGLSSNQYLETNDYDYLVYSLELTDINEEPYTLGDIRLSMGMLAFCLSTDDLSYYVGMHNSDFVKVSYSRLYGTSYSSAVWTSEISLPKSSIEINYPYYFGWDFGGNFKADLLGDMVLAGSDIYYTYGYRINFYFDKPSYLENSYLDDFYLGFSYTYPENDENYVGKDYFSYNSISNPNNDSAEMEQLEGISTGITNVQNAIDDMKNKLIEMSNTIDAAMRELGSKVENQTQQINNMVTQQTQEIREALGLVGDSIDSGITNIQTSINNQITEIRNGFENITNEVSEGFDKTVESVDKGFEDTKKEINEIPGEIKNMLTDFIVPDEDTVSDKMTDFQGLAEEKLGIIYQVPEMLFDAVNALVDGATNPQSTMSFPAFSLPWIDGSQLRVWDSQQFEIIPSGLENLRDLIQTVTSMVFVIMTFNSLKRAYERFFLGGGS